MIDFSVSGRSTRNKSQLNLPKCRLSTGQRSFAFRSAANQSYYLPRARTNYGIFNIRFQGPKVWNSLGKDIKSTPFSKFKKTLKNELPCQY